MVFSLRLLEDMYGYPTGNGLFPLLPNYGRDFGLSAQDTASQGFSMGQADITPYSEVLTQQSRQAGHGGPGDLRPDNLSYSPGGSYTFVGDPNDPVLRHHEAIIQAATEYGLDPALIAAIIDLETGGTGNPNAVGPYTGETYGHARGLMQVMDYHWQPGEDMYDPLTNIRKGASILAGNIATAKEYYPDAGPEFWLKAAVAAYLGDWNWSAGTYAGVSDVNNTDGPMYNAIVQDRYNKYANAFSVIQAQQTGLLPASSLYGWDAPITQDRGYTNNPDTAHFYVDRFHDGIDVGIASGTPLTAPAAGTITYAGLMGGYGGVVRIQLDNGYTVHLAHMKEFHVQVGQRVNAGHVLGLSGGALNDWGAGVTLGPHVHIVVLDPNGTNVDPREIFEF